MKRRKTGVRVVSMLLMVAMIFSLVPGMAATVEAGNEGWEEAIGGQPMMIVEGEEEISFQEAIKISEEFLEENPEGMLTLNMPRQAIKTIGENLYAQLQDGIIQANKMISDGYLEFDENFDANVTEKYRHKVMSKIHSYIEAGELKSVDLFFERNTIGITSVSGGVNKIVWHWWGFNLYLDDNTADNISDAAMTAAILSVWLGPIASKIIATSLGLSAVLINRVNRNDTGIVVTFAGRPPLTPGIVPIWIHAQ